MAVETLEDILALDWGHWLDMPDEPVADEPVADEPVADEPVADEPRLPHYQRLADFEPLAQRVAQDMGPDFIASTGSEDTDRDQYEARVMRQLRGAFAGVSETFGDWWESAGLKLAISDIEPGDGLVGLGIIRGSLMVASLDCQWLDESQQWSLTTWQYQGAKTVMTSWELGGDRVTGVFELMKAIWRILR